MKKILIVCPCCLNEYESEARSMIQSINEHAKVIREVTKALEWTLAQSRELEGVHTGGPNERAYRKRMTQARSALAMLELIQP